ALPEGDYCSATKVGRGALQPGALDRNAARRSFRGARTAGSSRQRRARVLPRDKIGEMAEGAPKTAFELAMERLRSRDAEAGIERKPLTDEQKAAIAEIRNFYQAKLAELEVLHQGKLRTVIDPAERAAREDEYRRDRERLTSERDAKIEKARA